jgi:hypothetical protein
MSFTKKKILSEANRKLEFRYFLDKSFLSEQVTNYIDSANKLLSDLGTSFDVTNYFTQIPKTSEDYLCIPKNINEDKNKIISSVSTWIDNNYDNKSLIEIKLKELIKLIKTVGSNQSNTDLNEQSGSDSIMFGNTSISKKDVLELGNDLIFILAMSLVYPKPEDKITRKFCLK